MADDHDIAAPAYPAAPGVPTANTDGQVAGAATSSPAASSSPAPGALDIGYLQGITVAVDDLGFYRDFGKALRADGVQVSAGNAVLHWIQATRQRGSAPAAEPAQHGYQVDLGRFKPEDGPYITSFLNTMHKAGATEGDVGAALNLYGKVQTALDRDKAATFQEHERMDAEDASGAMDWLRSTYGFEAGANLQILRNYLARLPESEREALENERDAQGVSALNSPVRLATLIAQAKGGPETREQLEALMGDRGSRYWKGQDALRLQALYRDLLRGGKPAEAKTVPTDRAAVDAEIAKLEARMRDNRTAWFRDEANGARLRDLYRARDGARA